MMSKHTQAGPGTLRSSLALVSYSLACAHRGFEIAHVRSLMAMLDDGWTVYQAGAPILAVLPAVDISATTA
jgi:hypothetical protein